MDAQTNEQFKKELDAAETLGDVLDVLRKYYDVENCKVGNMVKFMLIKNLDSLVRTTRCKERNVSAVRKRK